MQDDCSTKRVQFDRNGLPQLPENYAKWLLRPHADCFNCDGYGGVWSYCVFDDGDTCGDYECCWIPLFAAGFAAQFTGGMIH